MSKIALLQKISYFVALPPDNQLLGELADTIHETPYERNQIIFLEGEPCYRFYYLLKGRIRVFKSGAAGKEQTLQMIEAGTTFNEAAVLDGGTLPASAEALSDSIVWLLPSQAVLRLIEAESSVTSAIMTNLATKVRYLTNLIGEISLKQVTARVAGLLLSQIEQEAILGKDISDLAVAQMTQQQMAAMIGTVREMIGRALRTLQKAGAIEARRGHISIKDRAKLQTFL